MSNRIYNILFHTHTISGIFISALLYLIFFTGSVSFLRDEINAWERNEPIEKGYFEHIDFDAALQKLKTEDTLYSRDITFSQRFFERRISVFMTQPKDTTIETKKGGGRRRGFFYMDMDNYTKSDYASGYSLGEFFYRLHFFAQLNFFGRSGYFLAGLVAFFFLFAVVTGVLVHWNKIVSSFYVFRPKAKLKTIWTDAHVALGVIGLPYQFIFAVTGAFLIVGYMVMLPPMQKFLFNDNAQEMQKVIEVPALETYDYFGDPLTKEFNVNEFIKTTKEKWPSLNINGFKIFNYGNENMHVQVMGSPKYTDGFVGTGYQTFKVEDNSLVSEKDPYNNISYVEGANDVIKRLHFGDYGGYAMKFIYLILGFITCFVIISGVLIWLVARDKKNLEPRKKHFNNWLVRVYMSSMLSLFPATALTFILVKLFADDFEGVRMSFINRTFFWTWLIIGVLLLLKRSNYFTNKVCLITGAVFSLFIPIANGIKTGNWPWVSYSHGYSQILVIDLFWIIVAILSFAVLLKLKRK
ncbi:PepSY-associated TM helix domain-containing protein [Joostella sp. CR20]|uniref:PepSY-associated TM helix domain-containing protein n=1 Tax=Joostella sp. CR20 TaxID=2804312 RepID=UPI00313D2279